MNHFTLDSTVLRCDCGWGEDVFEILPAQYQVTAGKPFRMVGSNPERRIGDFASIEAAKEFLTGVMGYKIVEEA